MMCRGCNEVIVESEWIPGRWLTAGVSAACPSPNWSQHVPIRLDNRTDVERWLREP